MAFLGYQFVASPDPVLAGHLEHALAVRLRGRRPVLTVRLEIGKTKGPWRKPKEAPALFANTIRNQPVGTQCIVRGRFGRRLMLITVVTVPAGAVVLDAARSQIGTPYVFGAANGPEDPGKDEFDCSGLTQWAWATVGRNIPHNAEAQRETVRSAAKPQEGDLVFMWFKNSRGIPHTQASHVGLFVGFKEATQGLVVRVLDTRSQTEPVAYRDQDVHPAVLGYGRP